MAESIDWAAIGLPHLADDAPSQRCGRCGRRTADTLEFDLLCLMTQPDGNPCGGRFAPDPRKATI